MIRAATELAQRVEAADFVFRLARPDLSREARRIQAFRYALPPGPDHGVLYVDADPTVRMKVRPGPAENPIYVATDHGRFVGALICSCVVPDLPVRIVGHAVSPEYQGRGWGPKLIRHVLSQHAVVGGAGNVDRQDRRDYGSRLGFTHWYGTPDPNVMVGFNQPVELPRGLLFAVPIAGRRDIASAEARLRTHSRSHDRHDYARRMAGL